MSQPPLKDVDEDFRPIDAEAAKQRPEPRRFGPFTAKGRPSHQRTAPPQLRVGGGFPSLSSTNNLPRSAQTGNDMSCAWQSLARRKRACSRLCIAGFALQERQAVLSAILAAAWTAWRFTRPRAVGPLPIASSAHGVPLARLPLAGLPIAGLPIAGLPPSRDPSGNPVCSIQGTGLVFDRDGASLLQALGAH